MQNSKKIFLLAGLSSIVLISTISADVQNLTVVNNTKNYAATIKSVDVVYDYAPNSSSQPTKETPGLQNVILGNPQNYSAGRGWLGWNAGPDNNKPLKVVIQLQKLDNPNEKFEKEMTFWGPGDSERTPKDIIDKVKVFYQLDNRIVEKRNNITYHYFNFTLRIEDK